MNETKKHLLKDMTFREFERVKADNEVVLLPFGSQEEQGPAPMGDWMLTEVLADRVASRSGAVAAPTVPFGYADYFRCVPGGVQLKADTFAKVLEDICENFLDHGMNRLLVFNGHTGNFPVIDQVIRRIRAEHGVIIPCINVWRTITDEVWNEVHPGIGRGALGHGGDPMTSVYLHLFPDLVPKDGVQSPGPKKEFLGLPTSGLAAVKFNGVDVNVPLDVTDICDDGIAGGDPTRSSAEIGKRLVEHIVDYTVSFVHHLRSIDTTV
ncbi:MAG: creatininase family protein [Rhodospirillales bacterium]|nr:creatininase family protein [Rhodospirillales bacterium]